MRRPLRVLSVLALACALACLAACGAKPKESVSSSDPRLVVVDEKGLSLGGARVGDAPSDLLQKVDPLFVKLKEQREEWKSTHPEAPFDGFLFVQLGPAVTCRAAMSVYMTAAFAGYPRLAVKQGETTLNMPASIPRVPSPADIGKPALMDAQLVFLSSGDVEIKPRRCGGAYDVVPVASVVATVKELCGQTADCPRTMRIRCDAAMPMSKVLPVLQAVQALSPIKMELSNLGDCKPGEGPASDAEGDVLTGPNALLWGDTPAAPASSPSAAPGKKPRVSVVREGAVTVAGGLTEDEVKAAMKPHLAAVQACHEAGLARNPNLQGRVAPRLAIGKKGAVMSAGNGGSDLPDNGVVKCVIEAVSTASFPGNGQITTVVYPFMMAPK